MEVRLYEYLGGPYGLACPGPMMNAINADSGLKM